MQYNENDYADNFKQKLSSLIDNKYRNCDKRERRKLFKKDYSNAYNIDEKKFNNTSNEWLSGRNLASLDNLLKICSFFDCDIEYLITKQNVFSKNIENASITTGLDYTTIDELTNLPISEKHIVDAILGRTIISTNLIRIIREILYYSHPITKNQTYIKLDKGLTARDKDYEELEHEWNQIRRKFIIVFKAVDTTMWSEYLIWRNYKMAKSLFEQLGGTYRKESDYLTVIPVS